MHEKASLATGTSRQNSLSLRKNHKPIVAVLLFVGALAVVLMLPSLKHSGRGSYLSLPAPTISHAAEINPWTLAVNKIKEDRGEPTGKQAKVEIPLQMRHYSDTRRFLAIQVAEVREHHLETPRDLVDLAAMIERGELVTLDQASENYVLYGVGGSADQQPFTRYKDGKSINLYDEAGLQKEYARIEASQTKLESSIATLRKEVAGLKKRDRSKRAELQSQVGAAERSLKAGREMKQLLDRHYGNTEKRGEMFRDYESLATVAKSFPERTFDVDDGAARRDMKVRLLSSLRPEALRVLEEVAASYREAFGRPLPVTSLVRPDEYQHNLSKSNPNATLIKTPPHSTGLAFDIYYRFMSAAEQTHVMAHLARLKDEGRIEVLRENRDHYHVFAFVDGARPNESLIAASRETTAPRGAVKESNHSSVSTKAVRKKVVRPASKNKKPRARRRR